MARYTGPITKKSRWLGTDLVFAVRDGAVIAVPMIAIFLLLSAWPWPSCLRQKTAPSS